MSGAFRGRAVCRLVDPIVYLVRKGLAVYCSFFVSNSGMLCHVDRQRQTPEGGGLIASLYPYSNIKFMMP